MMGYAPTVSALGLEDRDPNNPEDLKEVTYWVGVAVEQLQDLWWNFMRLQACPEHPGPEFPPTAAEAVDEICSAWMMLDREGTDPYLTVKVDEALCPNPETDLPPDMAREVVQSMSLEDYFRKAAKEGLEVWDSQEALQILLDRQSSSRAGGHVK